MNSSADPGRVTLPGIVLVVVAPDVTDGPIFGFRRGLHTKCLDERFGGPDVFLDLGNAPAAYQRLLPFCIIARVAARGVGAPDGEGLEGIWMYPSRRARDHLHDEGQLVLDFRQAIGDVRE